MVCADSQILQILEKGILLNTKTPPTIKAYKQRWFILIIYIAYATFSTSQWLEYSIITDVIMKYYEVSASDVNWTSIIFMLMWPVLVFPTSFIIDHMVSEIYYISRNCTKYLFLKNNYNVFKLCIYSIRFSRM